MRVILTHTNADFDAVASLLALSKLESEAIPILPQRVNSNVEKFLHLYDRQWPMIRAEDIPKGKRIDLAYVVDTQRFDQVRGMRADTPVYIIDHHSLSRELPPHYRYEGEPLGATVTLLVERLIARNLRADPLEATLMLLGIYEDTGHLSYKNTQPRDLLAAAWLLEQGADLDLLREFLAYNMSSEQAHLLERLEESAVALEVEGYQVMIASAVISEPIKEAAMIAYELMSLFAPDALIMLLHRAGDNQLIARATVDNIDLGALMRAFGGNGHARAAAAIIRERELEAVLSDLMDKLPEYTRPATTVAALMSWGVRTLDADLSVREAQRTMQESGHEGYPVLEAGRLIGLVTQRAIDRAMLHNLHHARVREIMEAETHFVRPTDSIGYLKDQMLATRWGQMPVVDAQDQLIGIVTRTDLIKHWGERPDGRAAQQPVLDRMAAMLPQGVLALLEAIGEQASAANIALYMVGGIVRDLLLGRPNLDIDLVVEGDAIQFARHLSQVYGGEINAHTQFGTAKWKLPPQLRPQFGELASNSGEQWPHMIDFATARAEFYDAPTALPTVRQSSIKLDLHRRDFTINALAIRLAPPPLGQLLDFYNGERDLQNGLIRVLHSLSFIDDPTRMLRAVRFEQRFGFTIEPRSLDRMVAALPLIERLSGDRIRHELNLILSEAAAQHGLARLDELGILRAIDPNLRYDEQTRRHFAEWEALRHDPPWSLPQNFDDWRLVGFALLTYHLTEDQIKALCQRLLTSRHTYEHLRAVTAAYPHLARLKDQRPSEIVAALERFHDGVWLALWILADADSTARAKLQQLAEEWRYVKPTLEGQALKDMGLKAGPQMGVLLGKLREARLDGAIKDDEDERVYTRHYIQTLASE